MMPPFRTTAALLLAACLLSGCDGRIPLPDFLLPKVVESADDELKLLRYEDLRHLVIDDADEASSPEYINILFSTIGDYIYRDEARALMSTYASSGNPKSATPSQKVTPLHIACHFRRFLLAKLMINEGADIHARATLGGQECTPLLIALNNDCENGTSRKALADILLDAGAGFDGLDTPVLMSAMDRDAANNTLFFHLLERGARLEAADAKRLLSCCCGIGNEELFLYMLDQGLRVPEAGTGEPDAAEKLLAEVVAQDWLQAAQRLMPDTPFPPGKSRALHKVRSEQMLALLLEHVQPDAVDSSGRPLLVILAERIRDKEDELKDYADEAALDAYDKEEAEDSRRELALAKALTRQLLRAGADPTYRSLNTAQRALTPCALQHWSPAFRAELQAEGLLAENPFAPDTQP